MLHCSPPQQGDVPHAVYNALLPVDETVWRLFSLKVYFLLTGYAEPQCVMNKGTFYHPYHNGATVGATR